MHTKGTTAEISLRTRSFPSMRSLYATHAVPSEMLLREILLKDPAEIYLVGSIRLLNPSILTTFISSLV
jgi:hypothetical protein